MAHEIHAVAVAAEARRVLIDPRNRLANLACERSQAVVRVLDEREVGHDVMETGVHEQLGRERVALRRASAPRAAMNEYDDGRLVARGAVDIELFDGRGAV